MFQNPMQGSVFHWCFQGLNLPIKKEEKKKERKKKQEKASL